MAQGEIAVAVTFLAGRYHGTEWPPSGARLYQALVAGVMTGGYRDLLPEVEPALRWLERQEAPTILAADVKRPRAYRIAVPNNDLDQAGLKWVAGRQANAAQFRTLKTIESKLASGVGPHVVYVWNADEKEIAQWAGPLRKVVQCLHTLGWGVDMAFADVISRGVQMPSKQYSPSKGGRLLLNVAINGTLDDLHATYKRFAARTSGKGVDTYTRPAMIDARRYAVQGELRNPVARFRLLDEDCENNLSVPWTHCMKVAGWLRHAAAAALRKANWAEQQVQSYIEGHTDDGETGNRVSYVPLPSIAGSYPDGRIRRAMVIEPVTSDGRVVQALEQYLPAHILTGVDKKPRSCVLPVGRSGDSTFDAYVSNGQGWRTWRTVTPVVLHGFNVKRRGAIDVHKTEKLVLRAFEMGGFAAELIEGFSFQAGPLWRGVGHASSMLVPQHLAKYPRVHVEVRFRQNIPGPVLAGIGRHYGIGVFAGVKV